MTLDIRPTHKPTPKPRQAAPKGLLYAPAAVINDGKTIEWGGPVGQIECLTEREKELIRQKCRVKSVNEIRVLNIKRLVAAKTGAQIVAYFKGRKGYGERTVYGVLSALSEARGEGF